MFGLGAAGYAAGAVGMARDAKATDGLPILAGETSTAGAKTELTTTAAISDDGAFVVEAPNADWGVEGDSGQIGVLGDGFFGVVGTGTIGAFFSGALAALSLQPQANAGAPTSGDYSIGDMIVDANGELYLCRTAGNPGTWTHVTATGSGGGLHLLDGAQRYYDSRDSSPFDAGEERPLQIAGASIGDNGVLVPADATAVVGNIAVTGTSGSGNALVYPAGITRPNAASINWFGNKQTLNNALTVKLGTGGAVNMYAARPTHIILDISGYVL